MIFVENYPFFSKADRKDRAVLLHTKIILKFISNYFLLHLPKDIKPAPGTVRVPAHQMPQTRVPVPVRCS